MSFEKFTFVNFFFAHKLLSEKTSNCCEKKFFFDKANSIFNFLPNCFFFLESKNLSVGFRA